MSNLRVPTRLYRITTWGCSALLFIYFALCVVEARASEETPGADRVGTAAMCVATYYTMELMLEDDGQGDIVDVLQQNRQWWYTFLFEKLGYDSSELIGRIVQGYMDKARIAINTGDADFDDVKLIAGMCVDLRQNLGGFVD